MPELRELAETHFRDGFCRIAAAFDLADCREWRFRPEVQKRALNLLGDLMDLFKSSEIMANARVARARAAERDEDFQHFLSVATVPKKVRKRRAKGAVA